MYCQYIQCHAHTCTLCVHTRNRESETVKNIGEKTSSGLKRAGTVIKDTGSAAGTKISSAAHAFKVLLYSANLFDGIVVLYSCQPLSYCLVFHHSRRRCGHRRTRQTVEYRWTTSPPLVKPLSPTTLLLPRTNKPHLL